MDLTVQNLYGLLLRSKLLSQEEARSMYARWQDDAGEHATDSARFAAWMVQHRYLTEFQATLLARGHAEGFFLNDYKILDRLGKGRMAGVYRARHRLGQTFAIKVLPPSKARDPLMLARFQREAQLTLKLKHPNIVRAFQVGLSGEHHYLVLEHLDGSTLEEVLAQRGRLTPPEAVRLIHQALGGLQHIHEQGLVHRDLKPANLMLVPPPGSGSTLDCTLKILDIGLGRALFDEAQLAEPAGVGLTGEGVLLGTPDYMAPEQARDPRTTDVRADIYSLGCVLFHLLAGQPPFPDTNIISQMIRHASEVPRPLREFDPAIPDGLQQIVSRMLAKDPASRYATPDRAAQALEVFLAAGGPLSSPELDPGMSSFLLWLEDENKKGATYDLPSTESMPALPPKAPTGAAPAVKAKPAPPVAPSEKAARKGKKRKRSAAEAPLVDVDLITLPSAKTRRKATPATGRGLTRRDFGMFLAGVAGGLLAYAAGRGLAALVSRPRVKDSE
jgi:serine/threonine protein kinase